MSLLTSLAAFVHRQVFPWDVVQRCEGLVLAREDRVAYIPLYRKLRIAPQNSVLVPRMVEIAALIEELSGFGEHQEAMSEAAGDEDLLLVLRGQPGADPLPEMG